VEVILADQLTALPSNLAVFQRGPEPCAACWVPVRAVSVGGNVPGWPFCAPQRRINDDLPLAVHGPWLLSWNEIRRASKGRAWTGAQGGCTGLRHVEKKPSYCRKGPPPLAAGSPWIFSNEIRMDEAAKAIKPGFRSSNLRGEDGPRLRHRYLQS